MSEDFNLTLYSDVAELVSATAIEAMETISLRLHENGQCHIALTGGSLGIDFACELVELINNSGHSEIPETSSVPVIPDRKSVV